MRNRLFSFAMNATSKGLRIGFVDNKLDNFHANAFLKAFRGAPEERCATVSACYALDAAAGRAWAEKNEVPFYDDATAMNEAVDAYMILAPSNPEKHLEFCQRVFMFAKPTYVTKPSRRTRRPRSASSN